MAVYTSPEGFLAASTIYSRPLASPPGAESSTDEEDIKGDRLGPSALTR